MRLFRNLYWSFRQRVVPFRGIVVNWRGYPFLLFLDDRPYCFGQWVNDFHSLQDIKYLADKMIENGDTIIDAGANYGYSSTIFAKAVGPTGNVFAIEAAPHTAARMRKQLMLANVDSVVKVLPFALGAAESISRMKVSFEGRQDLQFIIPANNALNDRRDIIEDEILVEVKALDQVAMEYPISQPLLLKIDIEGSELRALQGAERLLTSSNPPWLLVEVLSELKEIEPGSHKKLMHFLQSFSPDWYWFRDGSFQAITPEDVSILLKSLAYINLLICPSRGVYRQRKLRL